MLIYNGRVEKENKMKINKNIKFKLIFAVMLIIIPMSIGCISSFGNNYLYNISVKSIDKTFRSDIITYAILESNKVEVIEIKIQPYIRNITKENLMILTRIVEAEATGSGINEKENVAQCILNRVDGNVFRGDTVEKIVFQKIQFSPIKDGRYYSVTVTDSTIEAVNNILKLIKPKHNALYFKAKWCDSGWFNRNLSKVNVEDRIHDYYNVK